MIPSLQSQYAKVFESGEHPDWRLPSLDRIDKLSSSLFLGKGGERQRTRSSSDRSSPYFPGLFSGTKEDEQFKFNLYEALTDAIVPSEVDDTGLCDWRAVPSDWSRMLTAMPGFQMRHATIPPVSTRLLRESYSLTESISPVDRQIALEVLACMTRDRAMHGLELSKKSSSSAPYYSKLPSLKKKEALHGLTYKDKIAKLIMKGDFVSLWDQYWVTIYHDLVYRDQPDGWKDDKPKVREVTDLLYALTGGQHGSRFPADKTIPGLKLARARKRTAFATAGCVNKMLSALFQPFAKYAYSEYSFTWKTTSPEHLRSKMLDFNYYLGSDTTAHDQIYSPAIFDIFFEGLEKVLKPEAIAVLRSVVYAPYHLTSPYLEEEFEMWMGDPLRPESFSTELGLPSGLGPNSFIGRWWMTSFACMILNRIIGGVPGNVDSILRGRWKAGVLNSADDMLFCFTDKRHQTLLLDAMKEENPAKKAKIIPPYMTMNLETPISFLGYVPYRDKTGELQVTANITSFVINRVAPERSILSKARQYWALGFDAVLTQFGSAPLFNDVFQIFDSHLNSAIGYRFERLIKEFGSADMIKAKMSSLSSADIELLENPDKIHYKFDKNDISPELYDDITLALPFQTIEPLRKDWYL